tara:strand:- start:117 stop:794 length:678 start_codon:yes stop_codon:yes gene_type:complete
MTSVTTSPNVISSVEPVSEMNLNVIDGIKSKMSTIGSEIGSEVNSETTIIENSGQTTILMYVLIILILAFLGFNLFYYLGDLTDYFTKVFGPLISTIGIDLGNVAKNTINLSADGSKELVNITAGTANAGIDLIEKGLNNNLKHNNIDNNNIDNNNINTDNKNPIPLPDESDSTTQAKANNKGSFCYIGQDKGIRSCVELDKNDTCMSGEIFPSKDLCINPNLRE